MIAIDQHAGEHDPQRDGKQRDKRVVDRVAGGVAAAASCSPASTGRVSSAASAAAPKGGGGRG
jgi:hypothetical protein